MFKKIVPSTSVIPVGLACLAAKEAPTAANLNEWIINDWLIDHWSLMNEWIINDWLAKWILNEWSNEW